MLCPVAVWIGVDVGGQRKGFGVAVVDDRQVLALRARLTCQQVVDLVMANQPRVTAIDSPRSYAPVGQTARDGERQLNRSICGIRWTPDELAALGLEGVRARTNQDQRDAIAAAVTARQHTLAMTETMGDIVVPASHWRPVAPKPQPRDRGPQ